MFSRILALGLIGLFAAACTPATLPPTALPPTESPTGTMTFVPTLTPTPTLTVSPTPTLTAPSTPFPALSENKPYLMIHQGYPDQKLLIYDQDGRGRQVVELPDGEYGWGKADISLDGKWVAFYTGSIDALPLTLNIFNVADGTVTKVADVVTDGYEQKLLDNADKMKAFYPDHFQPMDGVDWTLRSVTSAFMHGIHSYAWSPNGKFIAFAGQMDGSSSDVYVYEVQTGAIQRVTSDIKNVWSIQWSPDSRKIIFENSLPGDIYTSSTLHIAEPGTGVLVNPKVFYFATWLWIYEWLSPSLILVAEGSEGAGYRDLQALNVNTGQLTSLWRDNFADHVIDYENQTVLINTHELSDPENFGLYLVSFDGSRRKIWNGLYWFHLFFRGGEKHRFLASGTSYDTAQYSLDEETVGITRDGGLTFLGKFDYEKMSVSPDHAWMLVYNDQELYLYDRNDELVKALSIPGVYDVVWRPDSQAVFYSTGKKLYYLAVFDRQPKLVDECLTGCSFILSDAVWLP